MRTPTMLLCLVLVPLQISLAEAQIRIYETIMGDFENPPTGSPGSGMARLTFDLSVPATPLMRVEAQFSGLLGNTTVAHVHCCVNPPGNVGVATTTPTFPGFPAGVTSGAYDMTFDMSQLSSYNAAFMTGSTPLQKLAGLLAGLDAGRAYFNLHTNLFPGGEIRGFFAYIPEPATAVLAACAWTGLLLRRMR